MGLTHRLGSRADRLCDHFSLRPPQPAAWAAFIHQVEHVSWVQIAEHRGAQAALDAYVEMLAGRSDARQGQMRDMHGSGRPARL